MGDDTRPASAAAVVAEPPPGYRPCVGICLIDGRGRIFVARRTDTPEAWQMPQGGIDAGEAAEAAAWRELHEETGVRSAEPVTALDGWVLYDLPPDLQGKLWGGKWRGQAQRWFCLRFTGAETEIDLEHHAPEFDAWRWATRDEVLADIVPFKRAVYARVLGSFEEHLA
jgi:putative (di)nucleoside polyphosphate hydrolase